MAIKDLFNKAKNSNVGQAAFSAATSTGLTPFGLGSVPTLSKIYSGAGGRSMFKPRQQQMPSGDTIQSVTPSVSDQRPAPGVPRAEASAGSGASNPMTYGNYNTSDVTDQEVTYLTNVLQGAMAQQNPNDLQQFYTQLDSGNMSMEDMYAMRNNLNKMRNAFAVGEQDDFEGDLGASQLSPEQINRYRSGRTGSYDAMRSELDARILRQQELDDQAASERLARIKASKDGKGGSGASGAAGSSALNRIQDILGNSAGLKGAVGTTALFGRRGLGRRGDKQRFLADVNNLLNILTVDTFAEARARGVTFGAASEAEWDLLRGAASSLGGYAEYDPETGKLKALEGREQDIVDELQRIYGELGGDVSELGEQGTSEIEKMVNDMGYDYQQMIADGLTDEEIRAELGL